MTSAQHLTLPIALDAMGGDFAPRVTVTGALEAAKRGVNVVLVGDETKLHLELSRQGGRLPVLHAEDVISMDDHASDVRKRPRSSVQVATRMVRDGEASAVVSMGHSGATMASALFTLGRLKGVERPAILNRLPSVQGVTYLLDAGANTDVRASYYPQWARLATAYLEALSLEQGGKQSPTVGLLSVGEEDHKGSQTVLEAHALLRQTQGIHFFGNVEGNDIFKGSTDIVLTDGFTGNVVLKVAEGEAKMLFGWIRDALSSTPLAQLGGLLVRGSLRDLRKRMDPSEYGVSLLLGVKGLSFIGHGSADEKAVENGLLYARSVLEAGVLERVSEAMSGEPSTKNEGSFRTSSEESTE